ncbi:MAG: sulfatase-like hydrolase/transferase [Clostridiales bacterium]|nr:sulfatase-like hydrolase/transferase [Clostridiales bacterium]
MKINKERYGNYKGLFLTILKYVFSVLITVFTIRTTHNAKYILICLLELIIIIILSNLLLKKKRILGIIFNDILILIYNIQMVVLFFGNNYILLVMLTNIDSLKALSGKTFSYGIGIILVLFFSLIPIQSIKYNEDKWSLKLLSCVLAVELFATFFYGNVFSPFYASYDLGVQKYAQIKLQHSLTSKEDLTKEFLKGGISDYRTKSQDIIERPNVIMIFTEGLSQNIISDKRNIMPNISDLQSKCLNFIGYYNHTFATYRGLIGQLYSGYQLNNLDTNTLISISDIFNKLQYNTAFINTEPINTQYTDYLNELGFKEIIGNADTPHSGNVDSLSDKEAYELLFDTIGQKADTDNPFLVAMYTFGTHASFDSRDMIYGDGANRLLNKFYDLDYQFGEFIKKFNTSTLSDNTIIVFTTDHATYADNDFTNSFPEYTRSHTMLDQIPFLIYYKGMVPETIDADGRNSLDFAPTVLDYLDISEPNYFLGESLFVQKQNNNTYDTVFEVEGNYWDTDGKSISELSDAKRDIIEKQIRKYYIAKTQNTGN